LLVKVKPIPSVGAAMRGGDSAETGKEKHRWGIKVDIKMRTMAVFGIALGVVFSVITISDLTDRWDGTSMNYELTTAVYAAILCAVVIAGLYYSTAGTHAPSANKTDEKVQIQ
jgi:choline-glycine betaine transporter